MACAVHFAALWFGFQELAARHFMRIPQPVLVPILLAPLRESDGAAGAGGPKGNQRLADALVANLGHAVPVCPRCPLSDVDFHRGFLRMGIFVRADLRRANLAGTNLWATRFDHAQMQGADLSGADMSGAFLVGADLRRANLTRARLQAVWLLDADLSNARLEGAMLDYVDYVWGLKLRRANLRGATFRHSNMGGVDLNGADLSGADLASARGLTNDQLSVACGDAETRLPPGLRIRTCPPGLSLD